MDSPVSCWGIFSEAITDPHTVTYRANIFEVWWNESIYEITLFSAKWAGLRGICNLSFMGMINWPTILMQLHDCYSETKLGDYILWGEDASSQRTAAWETWPVDKLCMCAHGVQCVMIVLRKKRAIITEKTGKDLMIMVLHVVPHCLQSTFMGTHASHPCNSPEGGHITTSPFCMEEMKVQRLLRDDRAGSQAPCFWLQNTCFFSTYQLYSSWLRWELGLWGMHRTYTERYGQGLSKKSVEYFGWDTRKKWD